MASNSAFFDAFFPNVVANATVPSGSFSEDVAAALVFAAADATNAIPSPRLENVKLVVVANQKNHENLVANLKNPAVVAVELVVVKYNVIFRNLIIIYFFYI